MSKGHKFTNIPEIPNASPTSSSPARHPLVRPQPAPRNQHRALKRPSLLTIAPPQTPALVRKTALPAHDNPRHQHWCAKRPSLLTIDPRHQHWCAKRPSLLTIDPRHQHWCAKRPSLLTIDPRHQHWCAKRPSLLTIDPRHQHWCAKRPSLLTIDPRHQQPQPFPKCNQVCVNNHGSQLILHEYIKRTSSHPESDRRTCILLTDCLELRLHKQITQPCRLNQERQRSCARKASSSRHGLVRGTFLDRTHLASRRRPCGQRRSWRDGSLNRC